MKTIAAVLFVVISLCAATDAQRAVRTVTNADLAKHRDQRLAAERDYRDNYAQMGFPSPDELAADRERDLADRLQLAEQLRQARLEKERIEIAERRLNLDADRLAFERDVQEAQDRSELYYGYSGFGIYGGYDGLGFGGYNNFGFGDRFRGRRPFPHSSGGLFGLPTYRATPVGVIFEPGSRSSQIWSPVPPQITRRSWSNVRPRH